MSESVDCRNCTCKTKTHFHCDDDSCKCSFHWAVTRKVQLDTPDSDHKCTCTHTAFDHLGAAGTGRCIKCTCTEFKRDLDEKAA